MWITLYILWINGLLLNGIPVKVVSEVLGHKDIATTLRTYAHVLPGMQAEAARMMDSVLFNRS